ncbi:hypothetical protein J7K24_00290 [bacterium]|nr:hypothetical protein [bacterium]
MNWKQFLKPTLPKIGWFLLVYILYIFPDLACGVDDPCYFSGALLPLFLVGSFGLSLIFGNISSILWIGVLAIAKITQPFWILLSLPCGVGLNCEKLGIVKLSLIPFITWFSLIASYLLACWLVQFPSRRKKIAILVVFAIVGEIAALFLNYFFFGISLREVSSSVFSIILSLPFEVSILLAGTALVLFIAFLLSGFKPKKSTETAQEKETHI